MKKEIIMLIEKVALTVLFCVLLCMIGYDIYDSFVEAQTSEWFTFAELLHYKGIGIKIVVSMIVLVAHELLDWGMTLPDDEDDEVTV